MNQRAVSVLEKGYVARAGCQFVSQQGVGITGFKARQGLCPDIVCDEVVKEPVPIAAVCEFAWVTQQIRTPCARRTSASRWILATIPRDAGTSAGDPSATKVGCMSITTSAVSLGSKRSKRCRWSRRSRTRSMISWRIWAVCIMPVNYGICRASV